jgi:hypothetical protein
MLKNNLARRGEGDQNRRKGEGKEGSRRRYS